jgi:hypothetical protein
MTPERQRIAIGEVCLPKWKELQKGEHRWYYHISDGWHIFPDYLDDLNAMHEAEEALSPIQIAFYLAHLGFPKPLFLIIHTTASKRAEAFLRTIGKWEDKP